MGKRIDIIVRDPIDENKLRVNLAEGLGWHTKVFELFDQGKVKESTFPEEPGIFNLVINYDDSLQYNEIVLYRTSPREEKLKFEFYQEHNRVFCRVESKCSFELNKEIVMNELTEDQRRLLQLSKEDFT
jgi:hypothetical protein